MGQLVHLVHHDGVGREAVATRYARGYFIGDDAAQVAGMLARGVAHVVAEVAVHLVDAALDGLAQSAAANDGVEAQGDAAAPQLLDH